MALSKVNLGTGWAAQVCLLHSEGSEAWRGPGSPRHPIWTCGKEEAESKDVRRGLAVSSEAGAGAEARRAGSRPGGARPPVGAQAWVSVLPRTLWPSGEGTLPTLCLVSSRRHS